ncbi:E3 ubiquitin-protein ligase TRIM71-like [Montipora capricornis]|uniref:E3 ubiquitin-protein ligase TRIM71-like n=1 Tax=Montipora capricornis TaxID=246305 RepID=UPI0035F163B2
MDVQQLFKNLKKEAECPLCIETVKNPKTLPCLHSFCLECLDRHANFARRQLKATIKCPVCQTSFQIPETDTFENLPSSFHLNRLVDVLVLEDCSVQSHRCSSCDENNTATCYCFVCQDFLCASCFEAHQRLKATRGHRNVLIDKLQAQDVQELIHRPVMCSQQYHEDQPLEFYCEDCKVLICHKCTVVSHDRHSKTDTQKAAQEQKNQMADAVAKVKAEIVRYENEIKKQIDLRNKNKVEILNEEKKMTDTVEKLIRDLREHERKMKDKFREIYEAEQKHHATQVENFELVATQLKSCFERCQSILDRNFSVEILQTNHAILGRCNELLNVRKPDLYMSPHVHYLVEKKLDLMDRVVVTKTDPSKCLAEGQDSKEVKERKETYFVIVTKDSDGFQCYRQGDKIKVDILTPEGDQLKTDIKDTKDGKYTVTYTPQCAGQHRVEILVNGQPLTGSPWIVQVHQHQYQFAFQFGSEGKERGGFGGINDIDVSDKTGTIAVAEYGNERIQLFRSEGKFRREIRLDDAPLFVAFTDSGDLLTLVQESDDKLHQEPYSWLHLFNEEGHFIKYINDDHLDKPRRLSIASDGRIIITHYGDKKIKVLSPDGNDLLQSFSAPDCDDIPECAIYHQDKFFVSYYYAGCVKVFDKRGVYLHDIGCKGSNDGQFDGPDGLVIDKYNRLIVCDARNQRLQLFTLSGKFLSKIDEQYFKNGFQPSHVAINSGGSLIVADSYNGLISVFH